MYAVCMQYGGHAVLKHRDEAVKHRLLMDNMYICRPVRHLFAPLQLHIFAMDKMPHSNFPLPSCSTFPIQVWQSYIDCLGLGSLELKYKRRVICQNVYQVMKKEMNTNIENFYDCPDRQAYLIHSSESIEDCIMITYDSNMWNGNGMNSAFV